MTQNIFLTGPLQIGKSTALVRFLADYPGTIRGFMTRWNPDGKTLHMLNAAAPEGFTQENIIARRQAGRIQPDPAAFNCIGCRLLTGPADLFVMDELGFLERDAHLFCSRVWQLLESATPIVGVVRQKGSIFLEQLQQSGRTAIWTIDGSNRDQIPQLLAQNYLYQSV